MKKTLKIGLSVLVIGLFVVAFAAGKGIVGADAIEDPSSELMKIILYLGGGAAGVGILLVLAASFSSRR